MPRLSTHSTPFSRRALALFRYLLFLALASFLLLEIVGRVADPQGVSYYVENGAYFDSLIIEEPIGYRHRPNHVKQYFGAQVSINSLGLRDREVELQPADDVTRVLVMGDSFVFGIGVEYEDTISSHLEQLLNAPPKSPEKPRFETINMGVISYNTEQQLIQLETVGLRLQPTIVVLVFILNDLHPKMWAIAKHLQPFVDVAEHSYAVAILFKLYRELRKQFLRPVVTVRPEDRTPDNPRWSTVLRSLSRMNALCRERGSTFVVFVPQAGSHFDLLRETGRREGIPVVSIRPWDDPRWKNEDPSAYTSAKAGHHPTAEGNRLFATLMYESLLDLGLVQ